MPRRKLLISLGMYAGLFTVMAALLPWGIFMLLACAVVVTHVIMSARRTMTRYQIVLDSVRSIHGEHSRDMSNLKMADLDDSIYKSFKELVTELERKNFQLVEKNIQLLSIKEIGLTLVSSLDENKVVDAVINFLSKGLGYRELFVGIFDSDHASFNFYLFRDTADGHSHQESKLPLTSLNGLLQKSIQMHQSILIRDPQMHPIGSIDGVPLFVDSTMNSYLVVPLVKSNATQGCDNNENCILNMTQVRRESVSIETDYRCPACKRIPILGVVGVTDGFKAASLSKVDLVSVETLAVQLSTMLENNRLFLELKQEESFRDNVINSMMNGLLTVDRQGKVLFANDPAVELTGYDHETIKGMNVADILTGNLKEGENPVMRTLRKGRKGFQQEAWLIKKEGKRDPVILNTSFFVDEKKKIQGVLAVFNDMTRIKRMEEQILHLDKLAALGRFSSSIAHEIRNPLTGIAAGIQYLQRAGKVADSQQENINFILEEVDRIDRLIGDLMNVVRMGDLIYTETQLEPVIRNSIASMSELAKRKSANVTTEFPEKSRSLTVDADRITQVMINLVKNAIEASPLGGEVNVTVSFPTEVGDVLFDAVQDFAIIRVRDQGMGLTEEDKQRVFEPFFSKKTGGTGLGLYVTHSIIERHGGYIYVDSQFGAGTTFSVYLPVEQVQHGDSSEVSYPASG